MLVIVIVIVVAVAIGIALASSASTHAREERRWLASVASAHGLSLIVNDSQRALGFDKGTQRIGAFERTGDGYLFRGGHLAAVELTPIYESVTLSSGETRTNRGSQLVSAGVGAVVAGPAGAVIGGLSGSTHTSTNSRSEQRLASVELHVRFLSEELPYVLVATGQIEKARELAARLANIIDLREKRTGPLEPPERVTTALLSNEALATLPASATQRGWWSRTFG